MVIGFISVLFLCLSSQMDRGLILRLDSDYESYNFVSDTGIILYDTEDHSL